MKKIFVLIIAAVFVLSGCGFLEEDDSETTRLSLNLTDAPALPMSFGEITDVNIKISKITVSVGEDTEGDDEWITLVDFTESAESGEFDLLDLQEGTVASLIENVEIPAGRIGQIRFYLDAAEDDTEQSSCTISYIHPTTGATETMPVYIPSAKNSGLKFTGGFDVPSNGEIDITADFDVRKSLKYKNGELKMKPTIKLIVTGEAGHISGTVTGDTTGYSNVAVYAYEDGEYSASERDFDLTDTDEDNDIPMMGAKGTAGINDDGTFKIAFLEEGTYDLYVVGLLVTDPVTESGSYSQIAAELSDVAVTSGVTTTNQDITVSIPD